MKFATVLVRTLKPGITYDDFVAAWYPDRGFGVDGMGPVLATNAANERELLAFGIFDIPDDTSLDDAMARIAEQESVRHDRIADVIESTQIRGDLRASAGEFDSRPTTPSPPPAAGPLPLTAAARDATA